MCKQMCDYVRFMGTSKLLSRTLFTDSVVCAFVHDIMLAGTGGRGLRPVASRQPGRGAL